MKVGRNKPCTCGSGKKYKKCCNIAATKEANFSARDPMFLANAQAIVRQHQAAEEIRKQQQGHGNPIISWIDEVRGLRFVAVNQTVHWGKNWIIFPNFLDYFMKKTLGYEWGQREHKSGKHPLFRWLQKTQTYSSHQQGEPKIKKIEMMGFIASWLHLAYALYLIAHHDELPKSLLKRLRDPVNFMPAYYEAIVGAALAVAGMEISCAEVKAGSKPIPEFRAKSKFSGKIYDVEAKRKNGWGAPTDDVTSAQFQQELIGYVRDQIHKSSKKKLINPIFWFELNIPTMMTDADWRTISEKLGDVIRDAENSLTVGGEPIDPAYVIITNHTFLANEDVKGSPFFGFLQTIKLDDYPFGKPMELEAALEGYDRHRDIFWLMEAWKTANTVPTTFDGSPPEFLDENGKLIRTIKIGQTVDVSDINGKALYATVEEIISLGNGKAMLAVHANGCRWLLNMPLTKIEADAASQYTDAVFGNNNASRRLRDDDPFDIYDWFLKVYGNLTQEQANKIFEENFALAQYKGLPLKAARIRIAREYTKWTWSQSKENKVIKE